MCGIVAAASKRDVVKILMEGLRRLEYRGYDSAGLAVISASHTIERMRAAGKVAALQLALDKHPIAGHTGIAHTRWATHGRPNQENAHPHMAGERVVLVHNGIIENYDVLRDKLKPELRKALSSETDSEIVASLILEFLMAGKNLLTATIEVMKKLEGAYAICVMDKENPHQIIGFRKGPPLVVGVSDKENFLASDVLALQNLTQEFIYLEDGDIAEISHQAVNIYNIDKERIKREKVKRVITHDTIDKANYPHYMLKEIYEQPLSFQETLSGSVSEGHVLPQIFGVDAKDIFDKSKRVKIVACGTSYYAGLVARLWLEDIAGLPCEVEIASEFRYRHKAKEPDTLLIAISQSGETADTLAALRSVSGEKNYIGSLSICNVPNSSLARESTLVFLTKAGPEIGVCSTKAFTTQLLALFLFTLLMARKRGLTAEKEKEYLLKLNNVPNAMKNALDKLREIEGWAKQLAMKKNVLFLGRGLEFPLALEGALKFKEITYIHAEAYPAGELKHGPLALVDSEMPVVTLAPENALQEKLKSNLQEVLARGGELFVLANPKFTLEVNSNNKVHRITMPAIDAELAPFVYILPMQLLAYHAAVMRGNDVDQPRNLAKSVTVE